jgi:dTDP-4-amino-4,6-dideoxygalactose transaminase
MTTKPFTIHMVDTVTQYGHIRKEVDAAIREVLETGAYINGPATKQFSKNLASYLGVRHVIPCGNGTDALQIALMALDLKPGDEVISTPFTFFATAEVVSLLGLKLVFCDIHHDTFNLDVNEIEKAITPRTKCIIPVHLFGEPCDMEPLMKIADNHGLYVIEDNAQAIGADYFFSNGRRLKAGTIGHIGCTSFYPSKNLGAYGDAGAIYTQDDSLAEKITMICNHGAKKKYHHERIGVNSRLDSIQAAILDVKLRHLGNYTENRRNAADIYDRELAGTEGIEIPVRSSFSNHIFHQYTIRVKGGKEKRDRLKELLAEKGIPSMIYYPIPLHLQGAFESYGLKEGSYPIAEKISGEVLSLPMHTELDEEQITYIAGAIRELIKQV